MTRPSIVFVSPSFGRSSGGIGVSAERVAGSLREEFDVEAVVPDRLRPLRAVEIERAPGLAVHRLGGSAKDPQALHFLSDYIARTFSTAAVVIAFSIGREAYGAILAARRIGAPCIASARGEDLELGPFTDDGWRVKFILEDCAAILTVCSAMAKCAAAVAPNAKIHTVPNGVDPVLFPFSDGPMSGADPVIGMFGEIKAKKGLDVMLEALPHLPGRFEITGAIRDESRKLLHGAMSLAPDLGRRILEFPYTDSLPELTARYHATDVVCVPSHRDGMPNVLLEAMSTGRICVASAVGGALDLIRDGENGFLFEPGSSAGLSQSIRRALDLLRSEPLPVRRAARETVTAGFSWEIEQRRWVEMVGSSIRRA